MAFIVAGSVWNALGLSSSRISSPHNLHIVIHARRNSKTASKSARKLQMQTQFPSAPTSNSSKSWETFAALIPEPWIRPDYTRGESMPIRPYDGDSMRLFDLQPNQLPKLTLYRDVFYWCPYCQFIQLQLELKKIPYVIKRINMNCYGSKPREFLNKVPSGLLPALEYDGECITESSQIAMVIEKISDPSTSLLPDPKNKEMTEDFSKFMRLERSLAGSWLSLVRGPGGFARQMSKKAFLEDMNTVNTALGKYPAGPFFLGDKVSLVDCRFAPFMERIVASVPYFQAVPIYKSGQWPRIDAWIDAMETIPQYKNSKSDAFTHVRALPPQIGNCPISEDAKGFVEAVEQLPVTVQFSPEDFVSLDDYRTEAASCILRNYHVVILDTMYGTGIIPSRQEYVQSDKLHSFYYELYQSILQCMVLVLTHGPGNEQVQTMLDEIQSQAQSRPESLEWIRQALMYQARRVCTPRDMRIDAARQFQKACNHVRMALTPQ